MRRPPASLLALASLMLTAACVDETVTPLAGGGGAGGGPGGAPTGGAGGSGGEPPSPSVVCEELGRSVLAWSEGPYGSRRGETAAAFELPLLDGSTYRFAESFSGCESYVFIPDTLVVSDTDDTSLWERDLDELVDNSPDNAHYFFVSRAADEGAATESVSAMAGRVEDLLASLPAGDAERWAQRLHVVATRAQDLDGWVSDVLAGHGRAGFLIDPRQKIRGLGFLADVGRYSSILQQQGYWPWRSNLAYAAYDAAYVDAQTKVDARLESEEATVITVWDGEVLEQFAEADVILPSAAEMTAFDTLEIEIESMCPDPDAIEFGNCGAWDYLAVLAVSDDLGQNREIARFITSYHRETRWVVDASAMLPTLAGGGAQHLRWDFAPEWNTQPTATRMELRLSNRGKATRPQEVFPLWTGGPFNAGYNAAHPAIDVPIPSDATKVTLYALVTGHGAATASCSEFCNHQHEITVGGATFLREFPEAGTEDACIAQHTNGMVPNQGGTWWFGRGGWCPGQQVTPWVEDLTASVTPGQTATLSYRGLRGGSDPPDDSGDIVLSSYLVIER
ncbi:MAG: hypothetical protein IPG04_41520 [Polyangiaceae bacterium]|nr:hypothetical protein [Polyangiaceae bacterium]